MMRLQLKRMVGVLVLAAAAAMLVAAAVGTSAADASKWNFSTFPVSTLGEGLGVSTFLSTELNSVVCHKSHSSGSFESSTLVVATIYYSGNCELAVEKSALGKFKEGCPNILTNKLHITPLSNLNGVAHLTGILVQPFTGEVLAKFKCLGANKVELTVKGGIICETMPIAVLSKFGKVICKANAAKHGEQEVSSGELPAGAKAISLLTAESTLAIFKINEKDTQETTEDLEYIGAEVEQTA